MPKRFHKHKLLLDENMPDRQTFPRLNELFDVKHIRDDLNSGGLADPQVFTLAAKQKRLLVTYNIKDFKTFAPRSQETGIIGISPIFPCISSPYWLHQLLKGSLLGLAQAATEHGQKEKPDIGVVAEATAQETAEFP